MARALRALDLFCGAGGAGMGLHRAGFAVTGVDLAPQKHYPFEFIQADALTFPLDGYDLIWASPPCQAYTSLRRVTKRDYPDLISATRERIDGWGVPYIIENVMGAPLKNAVMLCGTMFDLKVYRHRLFESNYMLLVPGHAPHQDQTPRAGRAVTSPKGFITVAGHIGLSDYARAAMGIDWMTRDELAQAIPPAYSEYLAQRLFPAVTTR